MVKLFVVVGVDDVVGVGGGGGCGGNGVCGVGGWCVEVGGGLFGAVDCLVEGVFLVGVGVVVFV